MATAKKTAPTGKLSIATVLADYTATRNARLKLDEERKKLKVKEDTLLDTLTANKAATGTYGPYNLAVGEKKVPRVTDWPGFHAYIKQTGNFDMLHKRLTETAVMARVDNKEYVPGIVVDDKITYKITVA